jgi:hypothetical protein
MKWVTRARVRWTGSLALGSSDAIDPGHAFFVPPETVLEVAGEGATFDVPGVELGHHEGRCSFEAFLTRLTSKSRRFASPRSSRRTLRRISMEDRAAGLRDRRGFRHLDLETITRSSARGIVYDALYAYCRQLVS